MTISRLGEAQMALRDFRAPGEIELRQSSMLAPPAKLGGEARSR
jgi:hypothetical protein